jgi:dihydrofolate synthase / folylpolyglutamate synthase
MSLSYADALDYLYSLINYEVQRPERYTPDVVSLERPRQLMQALGNPQLRYPVLHLTGTKGKGSVSAMCASALQAAGLRVGLYSSPHLQDFRERFRCNGALIPPEQLAALISQIKPVVQAIPGLTWFEVITALAFLYFAQANVDIAVIEVGLGGRLDATNIIDHPLVSVITSLSYDHMHLLGNTLAEIAFEKAGIIKAGVPVVSAPQPEEALAVIEQVAAARNAPLLVVGRDIPFDVADGDEFGQAFSIALPGKPNTRYWTPLLGQHQAINGAVAATALSILSGRYHLPERHLHTGLAMVNWAGRLEVVRRAPYLILDVAHNGASAQYLREALLQTFPQAKRRILIFGAFQDKDVQGMFRALLPITDHLILMTPINPRAFSTEQLMQLVSDAGYHGPLSLCPAADQALAQAEAIATSSDLICATGSLSVVGELRTVLNLPTAYAVYLNEAAVSRQQQLAARFS